jgi:hypothetical protein
MDQNGIKNRLKHVVLREAEKKFKLRLIKHEPYQKLKTYFSLA